MNKSLTDIIRAGVSDIGTKYIGDKEKGFTSAWGWNTGSTNSGQYVNAENALQNDTVWACVKLISETVSTLPLGFYKRDDRDGRNTAREHPLYEILHNQPNSSMSAPNFWQAVSASILLWGNAYCEIKRNSRVITSLEFLMPSQMRLSRDGDGKLEYNYKEAGIERTISAGNVMHIRGFTLDGEIGLSAIQYGRNAIGSAISADKASDETFKNASRASGIVTMDARLQGTQREEIREHVKKVSGTGGVYVLEKGSDFKALGFNPHDAQLLESRSFSVETICRWFRVPPVMIGHGDKQSSWPTSTEAQGALFVRYVLRAIILGIEQEIRRSLLTPTERQLYFAEYGLEGLLRGDSEARASFYKSALNNAWMTANEVRKLENLPPIDGGDVLMVQSNMIALNQLGQNFTQNSPNDAMKQWVKNKEMQNESD